MKRPILILACAASFAVLTAAAWAEAAESSALTLKLGERRSVNEPPSFAAGIDFRLPASERLILDRAISVRSHLLLALPASGPQEMTRVRGEAFRPVSEDGMVSAFGVPELGPPFAGVPANYRSSSYLPLLVTLRAADVAPGYSGSPGLHSRWSAEIDQWIAMIDLYGLPGTH